MLKLSTIENINKVAPTYSECLSYDMIKRLGWGQVLTNNTIENINKVAPTDSKGLSYDMIKRLGWGQV